MLHLLFCSSAEIDTSAEEPYNPGFSELGEPDSEVSLKTAVRLTHKDRIMCLTARSHTYTQTERTKTTSSPHH